MTADAKRDLDSEVTRVEAVTYLQGALGHATASILFLLVTVSLWAVGFSSLGWVVATVAFLLSVNGISIWAWDRLRTRFLPDPERRDAEPSRTLVARPLSAESLAEMKAGAVMVLSFVGVLLVANLALQSFDTLLVGYVCVAVLFVGNVVALGWAYSRW